MLNKYEMLMVVKPDLGEDELDTVAKVVTDRITGAGGLVIASQNWGKRKLAYEIRDNIKGVYFYFRYVVEGATIAPLQAQLKITEAVLRFLTVKLDERVDVDSIDVDAESAAILPFGAKRRYEEKVEEKTEAKPEEKAEEKTEAKAEEKTEAKTEAKAEAKTEEKTEAKAEDKPEDKPEAKPEPEAATPPPVPETKEGE